MNIKSRSIKSISRWSLSRCKGKVKGYNTRLKEIANTIITLYNINKLTEDIIKELLTIIVKLVRELYKVENRIYYIQGKSYKRCVEDNKWNRWGNYRYFLLRNTIPKQIEKELDKYIKII